jgi:hypothetical protein
MNGHGGAQILSLWCTDFQMPGPLTRVAWVMLC